MARLSPECRARVEFVLAGNGDVPQLREHANKLGVQDVVEIREWVDPAERDRLLAAAHAFVLPSHTEGLPMSLLEAMAWGLPPICTPVGSIPEYVVNGANGLLIAPGDVSQLAAAIEKLVSQEEDRVQHGAARSRHGGTVVRQTVFGSHVCRVPLRRQRSTGGERVEREVTWIGHASAGKELKLLQVGDSAVRRNPLFYADAQRELERLERAGFHERRQWTRDRLSELLWPASRGGYGLIVRGGGDIASWPLLTKAEVRAAPKAFAVGSQLFTIKANTGGTSGAPLDIVRSLRSVVFEQVCIDRMMQKVGVDARSARCAVLRTESIKDPNDFKPPYWVHAGGGNRLVLSSTHLNAATIEHYARAIDEFAPECLLGYPTSLEALVLAAEAGEAASAHSLRCCAPPKCCIPASGRRRADASIAGCWTITARPSASPSLTRRRRVSIDSCPATPMWNSSRPAWKGSTSCTKSSARRCGIVRWR